MAGSPPVDPPETGAGGLGGGDVDPEHELIYTGKWPFSDPSNQPPNADYPGYVELHAQMPTGSGVHEHIHPFKLQFFTDEEDEQRIRVYTGRLTTSLHTFLYSDDSDTVNSYTASCSASTETDEEGGHTHEITCELTATSEIIDHFLTVGGQPKIPGMTQIESDVFVDLIIENADGVDVPSGFRAYTLPVEETYGKVYLTWKLETVNIPNNMAPPINVVKDVTIVVEKSADDPADADDPNDFVDKLAGDLHVTGSPTQVVAIRNQPEIGEYFLHIGTTYDADSDDADENPDSGIKQIIYENVYYSPLILPEYPYGPYLLTDD